MLAFVICPQSICTLSFQQSRLNERLLSGSDEMEDPLTPVGRKFLQLQQQIEQLQESLEIVENQKEDLQIRAELQVNGGLVCWCYWSVGLSVGPSVGWLVCLSVSQFV